jgi:hypothetical protein
MRIYFEDLPNLPPRCYGHKTYIGQHVGIFFSEIRAFKLFTFSCNIGNGAWTKVSNMTAGEEISVSYRINEDPSTVGPVRDLVVIRDRSDSTQ